MVRKHRASYRTGLVADIFRVKDEFGDGVGWNGWDGVDGDDVGWAGTATGRRWRGGERDESLRELRMSERDESSERTEMKALREMAWRLNKRMKKNRISFIILIGVGLKFFFFFLDVCYSAHLSNQLKILALPPLLQAFFGILVELK